MISPMTTESDGLFIVNKIKRSESKMAGRKMTADSITAKIAKLQEANDKRKAKIDAVSQKIKDLKKKLSKAK
jgi:uncharacterized coiled-coil protein SlyX